jgi:endonuclease/exonuclease/phosphatase family metal-dependent hydrolase
MLPQSRSQSLSLRVICWNVNGASAARPRLWDELFDLDPDLALLQEVTEIPDRVRERYAVAFELAAREDGGPQRFGSAILARGRIGTIVPLAGRPDWVAAELRRFPGNVLARRVELDGWGACTAVSVHNPHWAIPAERLVGLDVAGVKLMLQPHAIWVADLLRAALAAELPTAIDSWLIAGDFNTSETFDTYWPGGPSGNREFLDRMAALGLVECLVAAQGQLTPTFRNASNRAVVHQIDHLFATTSLAGRLTSCEVGDPARVFDGRLSDHLPIIAMFGSTDELQRAPAARS